MLMLHVVFSGQNVMCFGEKVEIRFSMRTFDGENAENCGAADSRTGLNRTLRELGE